jgi:hypothetical protein
MPKKLTLEQFIEKANKIHNNKYDYSKGVYVNNHTKIIITCKDHGEFEQIPTSHTSGCGCKLCGTITNGSKRTFTTAEFIKKAVEVHGEKYDYTDTTYSGSHEFVNILCKTHGTFKQKAGSHLLGIGCTQCGLDRSAESRTTTTREFIERANDIHNNKYDYSLVSYKNTHTKVKIICHTHGEFNQRPNDHLRGIRCPMCAGNNTKLTKLKKYGDATYTNRAKMKQTKLEKYGDEFYTNREKSRQTSIELYGVIHPKQRHMIDVLPFIDNYDWLFDQYITQNKTAHFIAKELGVTGNTILSRLHQFNIAIKKSRNFSQICLRWLNFVMSEEGIYIQHGENGGEYRIPDSGYRADGYCKETNTVYEFHGDCWHGNPNKYGPDDHCHPFDKKITAGELFDVAVDRENKIRELGYNLVVMWECDFK